MLLRLLQRTWRQRQAKSGATSRLVHASEATRAIQDVLTQAVERAQQGEPMHAMTLLNQVLEIQPLNAAAHDTLGNVLRSVGRIEEARTSYQAAIEADPWRTSAYSNLGLCLRDLGRIEEAQINFQHALRLAPDSCLIATNLAAVLYDIGHFDQAQELIAGVLAQDPGYAEARIVRGTRLLRRGDYMQGWEDYECRDRDAGRRLGDSFPYPIWDARPLWDKVLLVCAEQGLGDQIMFASCLPALLKIAPGCIVECDARMVPLFARSFPEARVYPQSIRGEEPWLVDKLVPQAKTWFGSLPLQLLRSGSYRPEPEAYLFPDKSQVDRWRRRLASLGTGPKIGISWRGGTASTRHTLRSIALKRWLPLLRDPKYHFVSLQYGDADTEICEASAFGVTVTKWDEPIRDYDDTAALVTALDLVISVQTSVIHLAGALGKPVWILVPTVAEWRYGERGERMSWYRSARLFRQSPGEEWESVMDRVAARLMGLVNSDQR